MLLQKINRVQPEKVFASVIVEEAAGVVEGDCVKWSTTGSAAFPFGSSVVKTAAATDLLVAGIIWAFGSAATVVLGDYCLMQVYGPHNNTKISGALAAAGLPISPSATAGQAGAGATADDPSARIGVSLNAVAAGRATIFIQKL